jgi:hypothetical protein
VKLPAVNLSEKLCNQLWFERKQTDHEPATINRNLRHQLTAIDFNALANDIACGI